MSAGEPGGLPRQDERLQGMTLSEKVDQMFGPVTEEDRLERFDVDIGPDTHRPVTQEEIARTDEILRKEFRNDRAASRRKRRD
jgi:hypothetical protein